MQRRRGFTLIELVVVIAILLILTMLVVSVFQTNSAEKIRSAARATQSAFLGARDRALHAGGPIGVRMIRDQTDATIVTGFAYIQQIQTTSPMYPLQSIQLERIDVADDGTIDGPEILIVRGLTPPAVAPNTDWFGLDPFFASPGRIRIPATTGQWYTFTVASSGTYALTATNHFLILSTPFIDQGTTPPTTRVAWDRTSANSSCDIELAPELMPNHSPISLPSGIVIDLAESSPNVALAFPTGQHVQMMFSPRGMVSGRYAAGGSYHFLLRDQRDAAIGNNPKWVGADNPANVAEQKPQYESLILTVFPQTGNVATFPIDTRDANGDFVADDLFAYAKSGNVAGQ